MNAHDPEDDDLSFLLREHFAAELDPQLGRGPAATQRSPRRRSPLRTATYAGVGMLAAVAATIVLAVNVVPHLLNESAGNGSSSPHASQQAFAVPPKSNSSDPSSLVMNAAAKAPEAEHQIDWDTKDEGTVFINGDVPMRRIRRTRTDTVKWTDPSSNAAIEVKVPVDEVVLVGLHAN